MGKPGPRLKIPIPVGMVLAGFELALARCLGRLPKMTPATARMMGQSWACDSERARRELGYDFRSLEEGLRETIHWYESHPEWVANIRTGEYLKYYERQYGRRLSERTPKTKLTGSPAIAKRRHANAKSRRDSPKVRGPKPKRPKVRRAGAGRRAG